MATEYKNGNEDIEYLMDFSKEIVLIATQGE